MAQTFLVAIALSALLCLCYGRPNARSEYATAEQGSSKAEPTNGQAKVNSLLYQYLKSQMNYPPWRPVAENNRGVPEPVAEPKAKPQIYLPYIPNVVPPHTHNPQPPHTHEHTHTVTQTRRNDNQFVPPIFQFPHAPVNYPRQYPPYSYPPTPYLPPFQFPQVQPVYRPPVFGYPFYQQQQQQQQQQRQAIVPPPMVPGGAPGSFITPPGLPSPGGISFNQPQQGKFGGYFTSGYNSFNDGRYRNRFANFLPFGFAEVLNNLKGNNPLQFLQKPYPFVPVQPNNGYPQYLFN